MTIKFDYPFAVTVANGNGFSNWFSNVLLKYHVMINKLSILYANISNKDPDFTQYQKTKLFVKPKYDYS